MNLISGIKVSEIEIREKHLSKGEKINQIATLGLELVRLREKRNLKKGWHIPFHMMEVLSELAFLGATLDAQGFVISD